MNMYTLHTIHKKYSIGSIKKKTQNFDRLRKTSKIMTDDIFKYLSMCQIISLCLCSYFPVFVTDIGILNYTNFCKSMK